MRKAAAQAEDRAIQQSLVPHLTTKAPQERVVPYSDDCFHDAAVQWLVETHQVCCVSHVHHQPGQPVLRLSDPSLNLLLFGNETRDHNRK